MRKTLFLAAAATAIVAPTAQAVETSEATPLGEQRRDVAVSTAANHSDAYMTTYNADRPLPPGWGPEATVVFRNCPQQNYPTCCENVWDGYCGERCCPPPLVKPVKKGHGCFQSNCCPSCAPSQGACSSCQSGCATGAMGAGTAVAPAQPVPLEAEEDWGAYEDAAPTADDAIEAPEPVEDAASDDASAFYESESHLPLPAGVVMELRHVGEEKTTSDPFRFEQPSSSDVLLLPEIDETEDESAELISWNTAPTTRVSARPVILRRLFNTN